MQTARRNAPFGLLAVYGASHPQADDAKAQKLTPPRSVHFALGRIDPKLELAGNERADARFAIGTWA
jgi:hypothetical protein